MNDERIQGYATLDLAIGVHLADWLIGKRTDLRVNAINVTDPHVFRAFSRSAPTRATPSGAAAR
jgi:iron complex outermembrane receptor protein